MMKKILIAASVAAALGVSGTAMAGGGALGMPAGHHVYLEGALGYVNQQDLPNAATGVSKDDKNIGGRVAVGYMYDLNPMWGIGAELGWGYYGKTEYSAGGNSLNLKSTAWDVSAVGTWHINPQFDLFGKAGMAYEDFNGSGTVGGQSLSGDNKEWKPLLGIGVGYNFNPNLQLNLTYTHIFGDDMSSGVISDSDVATVNSVLLGVRYTF
ncbi:outer membrane protein [Piscirickettsia litoralis]|uniref:Meta-pathway of phenol degradation family protein n=1 Tax=Piscirickettsia litoralis TaxID=1891921 RepID=A0ABX3A1J7_9GAMM|nr:outer membrane beta-barrel protein [Piscirickettsia litoralis]ODN42318.1 meta-pathway of phenol degradation family protein [Piscirickettsia litoralis]